MEPATMSDVKELMKDLLKECRESIKEAVAEAFGNSKPALEHATTSNASQLLTMDASDAKVPAPACSSPDQGTSAFALAPTATIDILSELDVDTTGVAAPTPVTCSTDCSPQQPMAASVQVASSPSTLTKYILNINNNQVAAVPLAMMVEVSAVLSPMDSTPIVQMQQHHNDSEIFEPTSSQCLASKVHVYRPMPWPSFLDVHANGDETRPLPWPSFRICASVEFPIFDAYGMVRSLELQLVSIGSAFVRFVTVLLDSSNLAALTCEYMGVDTTVCIDTWLFVGCLRVCWKYSLQSATHYSISSDLVSRLHHTMNCSQLKMLVTAVGHRMTVAIVPKRQKNSHMLLLSWVWEQEELHLGFQFQMCSILSDWYLGNQSIMAMVCPDYSVKYNSLADTWSSWLLCVRPVCATADAAVSPDGQHSRNWHNGQPAIARDALLFVIQSVVLNYMDYWGVTTVILTDIVSIFSARLTVQMEVICSVQTKLLLAHAYQLNSSGSEQMVVSCSVMVPCPIPVYDPMIEWCISMDSQCLLIGVMNMGYESMLALTKFSFAGNKLTCFFNSETPKCELLVASPELMWFHVALVGEKGTFQGGRHMPKSFMSTQVAPVVMRPWWCSCKYLDHDSYITFLSYVCSDGLKVPLVPLDPGVYVIAITIFEQHPTGHKYYLDSDYVCASDIYHLGAFFDWVPVGHIFYSYLVAVYPNSGYCHHSDNIKVCRLQWDPGGFSMMSAWGQAEFQGGRGVSNPSYASTWAGSWASGTEHSPGTPVRQPQIPREMQREEAIQVGSGKDGGGELLPIWL